MTPKELMTPPTFIEIAELVDATNLVPALGEIARRLALAYEMNKSIVDKLPIYADTGNPFVPGVDEAWVVAEGVVMKMDNGVWERDEGIWEYTVRTEFDEYYYSGPAYSTTVAAVLAAKDKK